MPREHAVDTRVRPRCGYRADAHHRRRSVPYGFFGPPRVARAVGAVVDVRRLLVVARVWHPRIRGSARRGVRAARSYTLMIINHPPALGGTTVRGRRRPRGANTQAATFSLYIF